MSITETDTTEPVQTREQWLTVAAGLIAEVLFQQELPKVRLSVGFARGSRKAIGQCWKATSSADETAEIFVCPTQDDPLEVLGTVAHELIHAYHPQAGHKGAFVTMAKSIGFTGPWTATPMGPELRERMTTEILAALPPYPHAKLSDSGRKKQGTRMLKAVCVSDECPAADDGPYVVRMTRKWSEFGMPVCPCGAPMVLE